MTDFGAFDRFSFQETRAPRGFPLHSSAGINIRTEIRSPRQPVNIAHFPRPASSFKNAPGTRLPKQHPQPAWKIGRAARYFT
jgi:hypothetical protein